MDIVVFHLTPDFGPDYTLTVKELRERGHTVIWGSVDDRGKVIWHNGKTMIHEMNGPDQLIQNGGISRLTAINQYRGFFDEMIEYLRSLKPDVVQFEPDPLKMVWYASRSLSKDTVVIQDIKQINLGVCHKMRAKIGDWRRMNSIRFRGLYTFDHTLVDYRYVAQAVFGENWQKVSSEIPVGIAPSFLTIVRPEQPLADKEEPVRFVYIGVIDKFRELETLIYACKEMTKRTQNFRLDLIGPDRANGYYQDLIEELDIADNVRIKDPVPYEDIPSVLNSGYEVGVAYNPIRPTWHMQPTIKVLEYRALGMPIISSDVLSHHDFVEQGVNGLLVENTVEAWSEAMLRFVYDRQFLDFVYQNALVRRRGNTAADVARMHEEVYLKLLQKK